MVEPPTSSVVTSLISGALVGGSNGNPDRSSLVTMSSSAFTSSDGLKGAVTAGSTVAVGVLLKARSILIPVQTKAVIKVTMAICR